MRIGVMGLGFMGSTHLKAMANIPGAQLGAVMDVDERRLSGDLSGVHGNIGSPAQMMDFAGVKKYRSVEEMAGDPDFEAVDVCLPTFLHAPVTLELLRAGKHVLVEKPMALDGAACDQMVAEAEKQGLVLMVAQVLRFAPAYQALDGYMRDGSLGSIRSALFRRRCAVPGWGPWEFDAAKSGGGVFDLLIHDVDICAHLFGMPESVSAIGHEDMANGIDILLAQFHYPGIGFVAVTGGWHHAGAFPFSMEFTVVGDRGVMEYDSAGRPPTLYRANGESEAPKLSEKDFYQAEIEYFVDCCRTRGKPTLCPPEESARSVKLALLMLESRRRNGERMACRI
jgi:predicted dehydrogenase